MNITKLVSSVWLWIRPSQQPWHHLLVSEVPLWRLELSDFAGGDSDWGTKEHCTLKVDVFWLEVFIRVQTHYEHLKTKDKGNKCPCFHSSIGFSLTCFPSFDLFLYHSMSFSSPWTSLNRFDNLKLSFFYEQSLATLLYNQGSQIMVGFLQKIPSMIPTQRQRKN